MVEVTPEVLASIAGSFISLMLFILPFLSAWFYRLSDEWKQATNLSAILVVSLTILYAGCSGYIEINFTCDNVGLIEYVKVVGAALLGNAATFVSFKHLGHQPSEVKHDSA